MSTKLSLNFKDDVFALETSRIGVHVKNCMLYLDMDTRIG